MGHAHHFLSRLDRVDLPETELALSFYNDPALLRAVIERAHVPANAQRVAVCLTSENDGPYVVVTRDAHFVTCLARGMSPGDLPVIPRAQLDAIAANERTYRESASTLHDLTENRAESRRLFTELFTAGDALTRETAATFAATAPVFGPFMLELFTKEFAKADSRIRDAAKIKHPRGNDLAVLRGVWQRVWFMQHAVVLMTGDATRELVEASDTTEVLFPALVSEMAFFNTVGFTVRGIWCLARMGKIALGPVKRLAAVVHGDPISRRIAECAMIAIGVRHAKCRAEILKALTPSYDSRTGTIHSPTYELARDLFDRIDEHHAKGTQVLRESLLAAVGTLHARGLIATPTTESIPDDMLLPLVFNSEAPGFGGADLRLFVSVLPALCRADAASLYLPARWTAALAQPWTPARSYELCKRYIARRPPPEPVRVIARTGRNEPCPCGSGVKFKKCCLSAA